MAVNTLEKFFTETLQEIFENQETLLGCKVDFSKDSDGHYANSTVQSLWIGFQMGSLETIKIITFKGNL